jgi:hypothetical protein
VGLVNADHAHRYVVRPSIVDQASFFVENQIRSSAMQSDIATRKAGQALKACGLGQAATVSSVM